MYLQSSIQVEVGSIHQEEADQPEQGASTQETQAADQVSNSRVKKAGNIRKKKRGINKGSITLGGLKKVEKALRRKEKNKMRKKLGEMSIPEGRKEKRGRGPLAPIRSVMFLDNTEGGELARRLQEVEMELGKATRYRVRWWSQQEVV